MAKIRGFKPDLWTDDDLVEVSPFARLLWLGMWNFACDNGHLQDKSKQIKMRVLPTDDVNCAELLRELANQGLILRADGWITVPNLTHHQKVDRRYFTTCSKAGCVKPDGNSQPKTRRAHVEPPRAPAVHTSGPRGDGDGDGDGDLMVMVKETPSSTDVAGANRFDEFWDTYAKKRDRQTAEKKWRLALKKPGVTADLLIAAAAAYVLHERTNNEGGRFICDPARWLHGERWRDEWTVVAPPQSRANGWLAAADRLNAKMGELA